jgi:cytoskeletal protein CcmA (bactofilin family)
MAIFGGSGKKTATPASQSARGNSPGVAGLSIIGIGTTVHGDVETAGVVKIEGLVNGHVTAGQQVLVAKGGQIDGDVDTGEAIVGGSVRGSVRAALRVEIQSGAVVQGDVTTKRISVAEGAVLNGAIQMGDREEPAEAALPRPVVQPTPPPPSTPLARPAVPPRIASGQ